MFGEVVKSDAALLAGSKNANDDTQVAASRSQYSITTRLHIGYRLQEQQHQFVRVEQLEVVAILPAGKPQPLLLNSASEIKSSDGVQSRANMADEQKKEEAKQSTIQTAKAWGGKEIAIFYIPFPLILVTCSDLFPRIPAKTIHREPGTSSSTCYTSLRPTCPTVPTATYALPTITPLLNIPQPPGL